MCALIGDLSCDITVIGYGVDTKSGPGFSCFTPTSRWATRPSPSVTDDPCPVMTLRMHCPYIFRACCPGTVTT
jgi:hypothetical protein